jgi:RecB family endonuclease NucS
MDEPDKMQVRELLAQGLSSEEVARRLGLSRMSVAAIKAHITMGTYGPRTTADEALITNDEEVEDARSLKFGLERDMQEALRRNIHQLDPALKIVDDGRERHVETGFIDILANDERGLVVIELKSGEAPETVITQILSYIGALRLTEAAPVRGIVIAKEFSTRIRLAAKASGVQLVS